MWTELVADLAKKYEHANGQKSSVAVLMARLCLEMIACGHRYAAMKENCTNDRYLQFARSFANIVSLIADIDESLHIAGQPSSRNLHNLKLDGVNGSRHLWETFLSLAFQMSNPNTIESILKLSNQYGLPVEAAVIPLIVDEDFAEGTAILRTFITDSLTLEEIFTA
jgi:hypothetical protein